MEDKEQLAFIVSVLKQIPHSETNQWFWDEVLEVGTITEKQEEFIKTQSEINTEVENKSALNLKSIRYQRYKIDSIYELAVRTKIRTQAAQFYENFRLTDIKESLIYDFVRMEHYRRSNDFENFCLAMFQQIEAIVNYLCLENDLSLKFKSEYNHLSYINKDGQKDGTNSIITLIAKGHNADTKAKLIKDEPSKWYFNQKLRLVLYFHNFKGQLLSYKSGEYENLYEQGNNIYQIRNLNHRGSDQTEYQKNATKTIIENKHRYYLKFLGFLELFVSEV